MRIFKFNKEYSAVCQAEDTRYGFRHVAELTHNGFGFHKAKCCYYNRTWESYTYQSVLYNLIESSNLPEDLKKKFLKKVKKGCPGWL